jgi:RNA polymerase sigma factor (sigma-70 family)
MTDGQLLDSFIQHEDQAALAVLVRRHGPMVLGVCRRMLRSHHDAEDAFQATFLVLVQKAGTLPDREMVGNWLYGVAHQTAVRMRALAAKRGVRERQVAVMPEPTSAEPYAGNDLDPILDEELARLPDKYRAPIILCQLEGKTLKQVAQQLAVPPGTVASRLATARAMLAKRLSRRGVLSGVLLAVVSPSAASACVPTAVVSSTLETATLVAVEQGLVGAVSPTVAALIIGVTKAMFMSKIKGVLAVALVFGLALGGAGVGVEVGLFRGPAAVAQQPGDGPGDTRVPGSKRDSQRLAQVNQGGIRNSTPADATQEPDKQAAAQPKNADDWIALGNAQMAKGKLDEAIQSYRMAIALDPRRPDAHNYLGVALLNTGQPPRAYTNLGLALKVNEAIAEFREAIRLKKDFAVAYYNLGNALNDNGQLEDAIAAYREAIRLKKDYADAHNGLGNALRDKGQLDEAIAAFREAIRLKRDYAEAHNGLGNALRDKGELDEAIAEFRGAIRLKKDYAEAYNGLGNSLRENGQLDVAIAACREAIRLKKDFASAHGNLGQVLAQQGKLDEAIACFRKAIQLNPRSGPAHVNLGNALHRKGDLDGAIAAYRKALELQPNLAAAKRNLQGALEQKAGK